MRLGTLGANNGADDRLEGGRGEGCADARFLGNKEIRAHSKVMKVEGCSKSKVIISPGGRLVLWFPLYKADLFE